LAALALASASTVGYANWGIPPAKYKITYQYHVLNGKSWVLVGEKTYHCSGAVTQWGNTSGNSFVSIAEPVCD